MTPYFDLGHSHHPVTTASDQAQLWFNRGLVWCYGFNHDEAIRCFEKVVLEDPQCAMGYWGLAYAYGPFYNKPWEWYGDDERQLALAACYFNITKASKLGNFASTREQRLIAALRQKYPQELVPDEAELAAWERDYADAMQGLVQDYPEDLDLICLGAEALMNLTRWKLWDINAGVPAPQARTEAAITLLEQGLSLVQRDKLQPHPGILHFYIHALEMSPWPEKAIAASNQLRDIAPECGHLLHMPCHIDLLVGDYSAAIAASDRAIKADKKYIALRGRHEFYLISCLHDLHLKMYASMQAGQYQPALQAADGIADWVDDHLLRINSRYLASTLEAYHAARIHVLVRFGRWQDIVELALPEDQTLYPMTTLFSHYAKAIAEAALGDLEKARQHKVIFNQLRQQVPDWHVVANNPTSEIISVAAAMLNGELEYHAGNHEAGFEYLREAVTLCDGLAFAEPWPWMHPPRHALAALLLEQSRVEEALQLYREDLGIVPRLPRCLQHRDNIWASHGYHECLKRLGLESQAEAFAPRLAQIKSKADTAITSSCCCRKTTLEIGLKSA